ncbi:hypothetical protein ACLKA7_003591 [Drosophila subpalustris]
MWQWPSQIVSTCVRRTRPTMLIIITIIIINRCSDNDNGSQRCQQRGQQLRQPPLNKLKNFKSSASWRSQLLNRAFSRAPGKGLGTREGWASTSASASTAADDNDDDRDCDDDDVAQSKSTEAKLYTALVSLAEMRRKLS